MSKLKTVGGIVKAHLPEILIVTGAVAVTAGSVVACVQTYKKFDNLKTTTKERYSNINEAKKSDEYDKKTQAKDFIKATAHNVWDFTKVYGPSILMIGGGIACMGVGAGLFRKRWLVSAAAAEAIGTAFTEYRKRVTDKYGEDIEKELYYGYQKVKAKVQDVDPETGEVTEKEKEVYLSADDIKSLWSVLFDEVNCPGFWSKSPGLNEMRLRHGKMELQKRLEEEGYLYVRDVLIYLGFHNPTIIFNGEDVAATYGWVWCPERRDEINFGIFEVMATDPNFQSKMGFLKGDELNVWIDLNPSGDITKIVPEILYRKALRRDCTPWDKTPNDKYIDTDIANDVRELRG